MFSDLISIGECMVEMRAKPNSPTDFKMDIGGDTFNAAAMAAHLGSTTKYYTKIGEGFFTDYILKRMKELNVGTDLIVKDDERTNGLYVVRIDEKGERDFQYFRSMSAATQLQSTEISQENLLATKSVLSSGISQAISTNAQEAVDQIFELLGKTNIVLAYDINYRAGLWSIARAAEALRRILNKIELLFLSEDDLPVIERLGVNPNHLEEISEQGPKYVILRRGAKGASLYSKGQASLSTKSLCLDKIVDTTGAGDVFTGAFLNQYLSDKPAHEAFAFANAACAIHISRWGTLSQLPTQEEILKVLKKA